MGYDGYRLGLCAATVLAATLSFAAGCHPVNSAGDTAPAPMVVSGKVTDLPAFEAFIALKPTPEQFMQRYPDVLLVMPGTIATKEYRTDNSRYFPKLDPEGRIIGGKFM